MPLRRSERHHSSDPFEEEVLSALDSVYRFARQLTQDPVDAEDLVQDTYLRAFQNRQSYTLGTNCIAWLFTICRNHWIQKRQREDRVTAYDDAELEDIASNGPGAAAQHQALAALFDLPEFDDALAHALSCIPERYRTPVVLIDAEDRSYAMAAEILDIPIGTIRSRLFRGRRLLQRYLIAYAEDAGLLGNSDSPSDAPAA